LPACPDEWAGHDMIILDEVAATALFDVLGTWIADQGVEIG
jgi:hypothetical protein